MFTGNFIVTTAVADADIQQFQIVNQVANYEYKCKYYTMRLREVNASTNMIQGSLNKLSEEGWILDETILHTEMKNGRLYFKFSKGKKNNLYLLTNSSTS